MVAATVIARNTISPEKTHDILSIQSFFSTCMPKIHISLKRNSRNCFEFTTVAARNKGQLVVLADENAQKHGVLV